MDLNEARKRLPELAGLSDESALNVIHQVYYPNMDRAALADRLGFKAAPPPVPERSMARAAGDLGLQFAGGAVSGVRMMSDLFGADNAVSGGLRGAEDALRELQSAAAKADQQRIAEIMKEAESKGFGDQVIAGVKAFGQAPAAMIAQALGTSVPTLATALIPGVGQGAMAARLAAFAGVGAAQGAGNIKGVIYEDIKNNPLPGETPEQTEFRAVRAQEYGGQNTGQIALGGVLGAAAGSTGMERALSGLRNGVTQAAPGMVARVGMGAAAEAVPEIAQGGQEKLASNLALRNEGFDVDPMAGVVAGATMEGLAGGLTGGVTAIPRPAVIGEREPVPVPVPPVEPPGPMTKALNAGGLVPTASAPLQADAPIPPMPERLALDPAEVFTGPQRATYGEASKDWVAAGKQGDVIRDGNGFRFAAEGSPELDAWRSMLSTKQPEQSAVTQDDVLDDDIGDIGQTTPDSSSAAGQKTRVIRDEAGQWVPTDAHGTPLPNAQPASSPADAIAKQGASSGSDLRQMAQMFRDRFGVTGKETDRTFAAVLDDFAAEIESGKRDPSSVDEMKRRYSEILVSPAVPAGNAGNESQQPLATDILNPKGLPFKTLMAANLAAKTTPGTVIEVPGGYAIRPQESTVANTKAQNAAIPEAIDFSPAQEAGAGRRADEAAGSSSVDARRDESFPADEPAAADTTGEPALQRPVARSDAGALNPGQTPRTPVDEPRSNAANPGQSPSATPVNLPLQPRSTGQGTPANVQDAPQPTTATGVPTKTRQKPDIGATAVEAPAPARGDGAAAAGVPDAGAGAGVRADGVNDDAPTAQQLRDMPIDTKEQAKVFADGYAKRLAAEAKYGQGRFIGANEKPWTVANADLAEKNVKANEAAELNYWQKPYEEAIKEYRFQGLPRAKWEAERKKRGLPADLSKNPQELNTSAESAQKTAESEQVSDSPPAESKPDQEPAQATDAPADQKPEPQQPEKPKATRRKSEDIRDARWQEMNLSQRERIAEAIGRKGIFAQKLAEQRWDRIAPEVKVKLRAALDAAVPAVDAAKPAAPAQQEAKPASEFNAQAAWDSMTPAARGAMLDKWAGAGQTDMGERYKSRAWGSFNAGEKGTLAAVLKAAQEPATDDRASTVKESLTTGNPAADMTRAEMVQKGRDDFAAGVERQAGVKAAGYRFEEWLQGWNEAKADAEAKAAGKVAVPSDFPLQEVSGSYSGISHSGGSRARSDRDAFVERVQSLYDEAKELAKTEAQQTALDRAIQTYKGEYIKQTLSLARVRAGTYSAFVAGRSNINKRQADSRNSALDKAIDRFSAWDKEAAPKVKAAVLDARTADEVATEQADKDAAQAAKQEKRQKSDMDLMRKILAAKGGDPLEIGGMVVTKVNNDKDGYPLTLTIKAKDGAALTNDKLNLATEVFGRRGVDGLRQGKEKIRALVDAIRAEGTTTAAEPKAEAAQTASKTPTVDRHEALMKAVREGKATAEQFKAAFESLVANKDAVLAELETKTKAELLKAGGYFIQMRYASEKKGEVIDAIYRQMVGNFVLGETLSYGMGKGAFEAAVRRHVEATDDAKLEQYAKDRQAAIAEAQAERAAKAAAMDNPQTLADFKAIIAKHIGEGKSAKEAFLSLTPEQRIQFDTLAAESTREAREARKRERKTEVRAAGQTTGGEIIATKHTRDNYDLFVVKLADRLSREDYTTVLASAKKLGGWYSAFRGNGAIPGFQFKDKANAEAFLKLAGGDTTDAQTQAEQRRDAFEDDRSETAVERLRTMADKLTEQAAEIESADRKTNTARRARFAASALNGAAEMKAKASTMRNIAQAIEAGGAKFLDAVRTKSQIDLLTGIVATAKNNELRAKYPSYADQEKRRGEPATAETADFAEFPAFTAYRSDLATLGRQLLEVDGTKKLGQRLMSVADDVSDAYLEFAKQPANLFKLSTFSVKRGEEVRSAIFGNREQAETAIKRSGLNGKAIVLAEKRGVNRIIMSPSEAINAGIWTGDGDKRITLSTEFGNELVEAIGRRGNKSNKLTVPWQFQNAYDRRKALSRLGIETASEYRSALREFIGLQERAIANKVREMELQMVGRKADGLDFFPTPAEIADQMIEAADITPDMAVLEPSAGMGHIADRIREAGAEPDVIEISPDRRELLLEKGYHLAETDDFMAMEPRKFFTYGDVFRAPDGTEGVMQGSGGMGSRRVVLKPLIDGVEVDYRRGQWYDRDELTGIGHRGSWSGYDRIIMNPPFSNRRDAEHVMHAYTLLKPGGRIVAIMGEGVFFGQDKKAQEFREWLESVNGTSEKLPAGSFMDPSLPVNTGVSARMVVIDKPAGDVKFSIDDSTGPADTADYGSATQAHRDAAARFSEAFGNRLAGSGPDADLLDAVAPREDTQRGRAAASVAAVAQHLFNREVVFVKFRGEPKFNGAVSKAAPGFIFLNIDSQKPLMAVLGHELLHEMAKSQPAMYANLSRRLDGLIKNETEYGIRLVNQYKKQGISTKGLDAREELEADIVGDNFMDAEFWQAMGENQPGLFKRIVGYITRWLDGLTEKLTGYRAFGTDEFLADIAAARDAVAGAMREFSGAEVGAVADPVIPSSGKADIMFSVADDIKKALPAFDVKTAPKNSWAHYRGMTLQALGRRQIVDLYAEELPQLAQYDYLVQKMDAEKNDSGAEADKLAQDWGKLKDEKPLAELMHDATLAQIDPAKPMEAGVLQAQYRELKARFDALTPEAQALYRQARDMYDGHYRKVQKAIKERIERSEMSAGQKRQIMAKMDEELFKKLKGVYFPLARFGQYVIVVKDANGEVKNVTRAETVGEAEEARKELHKAFPKHMGYTVGKVLKQAEFNAGRDAVGKGFMADLMDALDAKGIDDELRDTVAQLYLSSLPDLSWAKHGIHRKGTPGFSQDARRAFAQNMFHGARYLAKLRYADQLQDELIAMQDHVKAYEGVDEYDSIQAQQVVDEMVKRHEIMMNPKTSGVSTWMTSMGFVFHLGLSPASAMVNLSQTALVAYPMMGAKWGWGKASAALLAASQDVVKAKNDLGTILKGAELDAYERAVKDGTIDVTMAHDLAGISQGEDQKVFWKIRPVMRAASFMFHHAERFNRQATFIAAWRMAKEAGPDKTADQLYEEAKKLTYDSHFDYSASNRPRVMQGNWQRVIFLFRQYSQAMVYTLSRNAYLSMKGLTPADRALARRNLSGILATHAAAAGVLGLPLVGPLLTAASFIGSDDDEPWDAEVAMQNVMADMVGPKAAEVMARGFSRLTPFDLSGRVALNKLILPDVQEGLEGKQWAESAMAAALGPVAGIGVNMARGFQKITEGHYMTGLEDMMPTALRGPLKAMRYASEGAVDKTGVVITDEVGPGSIAGQALGFSPSEVRRATERKAAIMDYDRSLADRRSALVRQWAEAQMAGDTDGVKDVMGEIQGFNQKNPNRKITMPNLIQSVRARRRRIEQAEDGVYLPKNREGAREAVRF